MRFIAFVSVALFALSCSKDKPKSQYPALTVDQRNTFAETLTSAERTQTATGIAKKGGELMVDERGDNDTVAREMATRMTQAQCTLSYEPEEFKVNEQTLEFKGKQKASISGATCPVEMNVSVYFENKTVPQKSIDISLSAKGNYTIKDAEYKKLNDIYEFVFAGGGSVMHVEGNTATTDLNVQGMFRSQIHGDLPFTLQSSGSITAKSENEKEGEMSWAYVQKFPTFTAEIKMLMVCENEKCTTEVLLNGETLKQEEMRNGDLNEVGKSLRDILPLAAEINK